MGIFGPIGLIIAGIILRANPLWFGGAATVGTVCLWFGIGILIIWGLCLLLVLLVAATK